MCCCAHMSSCVVCVCVVFVCVVAVCAALCCICIAVRDVCDCSFDVLVSFVIVVMCIHVALHVLCLYVVVLP